MENLFSHQIWRNSLLGISHVFLFRTVAKRMKLSGSGNYGSESEWMGKAKRDNGNENRLCVYETNEIRQDENMRCQM